MIDVECPECGGQFKVAPEATTLLNRFYCTLCDALIEVIEEDPLILDLVDEYLTDSEDEDDWPDR